MAFISSGSMVESVKGVRIRVKKKDVNGYTVKGCSCIDIETKNKGCNSGRSTANKDKLVYNCCLLAIWTLIKC